MKSSKGPVIVLAVVLLALIAVPLFLFFAPVGNGGRDPLPIVPGALPSTQEGDLAELLNRATHLVEDRMSAAVRNQRLALDRLQRYRGDLDRVRDAVSRGRTTQARERLERLLAEGEAEMAAIEARDEALALSESLTTRIANNRHLAAHYEQSFSDIQERFEQGKAALRQADYATALEQFESVAERLDALRETATAQANSWLADAEQALREGRIQRAKEAFEKVLSLIPEQADANAGLADLEALAAMESELSRIQQMQQAGELDAALAALAPLLEQAPDNPTLRARQKALQDSILDRDHSAALTDAEAAAAAGDLDGQIAALERALDLKADNATLQLLRDAVAARDKQRLESILSDAFTALRAAQYSEARDLYRQALELDSNSAEAKEGLERAARLLIAEIEFRENLASAQRMANEGRFPMAASFFNRAMATRPANLPETDAERHLRTTLERESKQVTVTIRSDNQTHVSIVGVMRPEQFRSRELTLYPDVYRIRGTRRGQPDVEKELRVSVEQGAVTVTVIADGR